MQASVRFDGTFETWGYGEFSQVKEHVDQLGRRTVYTIDPNNGNTTEVRVIVGLDDGPSTETDDLVTKYEYEAYGLVKSVVTLRSNVNGATQLSGATTFQYTTVTAGGPGHTGRWLASTNYGGDVAGDNDVVIVNGATVAVTARNAYGMPTTVRDEVNRDTLYAYDDLDRVTKVTLPNPGYSQLQPVTEYVYTLAGRLQDETMTRVGAGPTERITTHYEFDLAGRIAVVYRDFGGPEQAQTITTYDLAGNVTNVTDALGHDTSFTYDTLDRVIRVSEADPDGTGGPLAAPVTLLAYDALGRLIASRDQRSAVPNRSRVIEPRVEGVTYFWRIESRGGLPVA